MNERENARSRLSTVVWSAIMAFHVDSNAPSAMPAMMLAAKKYDRVQREGAEEHRHRHAHQPEDEYPFPADAVGEYAEWDGAEYHGQAGGADDQADIAGADPPLWEVGGDGRHQVPVADGAERSEQYEPFDGIGDLEPGRASSLQHVMAAKIVRIFMGLVGPDQLENMAKHPNGCGGSPGPWP